MEIFEFFEKNILLYSIDIDSFSTIPYEFQDVKQKILINAERLYLIECPGELYESEIGSCTNWTSIGWSKITSSIQQVYCSYNKGGICITIANLSNRINRYKFNLKEKPLA